MTIKSNRKTYISLFSGAGVGCYGFTLEGFECIATAEFIEKRLKIQEFNNKCKYKTGYISDDLTSKLAKEKIENEINYWKKNENIKEVDVIIATPPCQGMSVANHKKKNELARNSLVVESIKLTNSISPKVFVFENVRAFLGTICTDIDGIDKPIKDTIESNLGGKYNIHYQILNFKDYGNNSSRTRTLVIGIRKDIVEVTPLALLPTPQKPKNLRQIIGHLPKLRNMGDIDKKDIYHQFRPYAIHMLDWIKGIKEGQSAFDNIDKNNVPHTLVNGKIVINTNKNGDKYSRCYWDKVAPCVHTRNDILASQSTIHPEDNRVFSIRELMQMMTIPNTFKWSQNTLSQLNSKSLTEKRLFLAKEELNIRQSIGEAVPTYIFQQIAKKINKELLNKKINTVEAKKIITKHKLVNIEEIQKFLSTNITNYSYSELSKIAEYANAKRLNLAAYYTRQDIVYTLVKDLPSEKNLTQISILEPSVGVGNFLPVLIEKYSKVPKVTIDVVDIDENALNTLKILLQSIPVPEHIKIKYIHGDFLTYKFDRKYDIVIGNPPFGKIDDPTRLSKYKSELFNKETNNLASYFIEKSLKLGSWVSMILPKSILSAPEFNKTRILLDSHRIIKICDYGEKAFKGVKIETISLVVDGIKRNKHLDNDLIIESYITNKMTITKQNYICSNRYPYWLIYRNQAFDSVAETLTFNVFKSYRDRQITKKMTYSSGKIRVLKSRNIGDGMIINKSNYDSYVDSVDKLSIAKYMNINAVLVPNLTYNPRAVFLPKNTIVDGSIAILIPKNEIIVTQKDLNYYNTDEFIEFYKIARNYGTRSLNIDNNSSFFFGLKRKTK